MNKFTEQELHAIRQDFPMLMNHKELTYLDSASTAFTPQSVIDSIVSYYTMHNTNTSRGVDKTMHETTVLFEGVRTQVKDCISAATAAEIVFTRGATAALNLAAFSFGRHVLNEGDEIILNIAEHHANILPWQRIAQEKKAQILYVDLDETGAIDHNHLVKLLSPRTKIVSFAHVTNVLGSYNDPRTLTRLIKEHSNAYVVVDGCQGMVQEQVDVQACGCDFYAFSAHKLFGPTGVGVLYGKSEHLAMMEPFEYGGDMNDVVHLAYSEYKEAPHRFEAGTMMIAEVFGLGAALDYMAKIGWEAKSAYVADLRAYAIEQMKAVDGIIFYNENNVKSPTICFNIAGVHAHDAASVFSKHNVILRAGHHCAQLLLERLAATSSLRISFSIYTTKADVDRFIVALKKAGDFLDALFG